MRPPYWSVQMPSISRISEPVRIGVPTSRPNCVSLSPRSLLDLHADDGEDRPDREADGEGDGREPQGAALVAFADCWQVFHWLQPRSPVEIRRREVNQPLRSPP